MNNCKNRQRAAVAAAGVLGILLLAAPEAAAEGFASGTALCLASVLPALFPFFVVCELLTAAPPPARLLRPLQRLLGLEAPEAAQAVALSWLGGYAVSAQLAGRLYGAHRISRRDARRLLLLGCCWDACSWGYYCTPHSLRQTSRQRPVWIFFLPLAVKAALFPPLGRHRPPRRRHPGCPTPSPRPSVQACLSAGAWCFSASWARSSGRFYRCRPCCSVLRWRSAPAARTLPRGAGRRRSTAAAPF